MTVNFHEMSAYFATAGAALERQPVLERERDDALRARDEAQRHAQALEERIADLKSSLEIANSNYREATRERDTFRDEARNVASQRDRLVSAFETAVGMVQDEIRQIVPQPEPEAAPTPEPVPAEPFPHSADPAPTPPSDPTPSTPYTGKLYVNMIGFVNRWDWLAEGGTDETYDWREGAPLPEGVASSSAGKGEHV